MNDVKLQEGHPVDENLRPIKVGGVATALEISKKDVRVNNLYVNGTTTGVSATDDTKLPLAGGTMTGDITTDSNIVSTDLTIDDSGDITLDAGTGIIKFHDSGDTNDSFRLTVVGGTGATTLQTLSDNADGHLSIIADGHVEFDNCAVGFDLVTAAYGAGTTAPDFKLGNKIITTFGAGNIAAVKFLFPATSGNFVYLLKQDSGGGGGGRTVTAWLAYNAAQTSSSTVKFAGGSNPTLTTDANHVDIISIFWDADNEIAYGVATLDFQF